MNTLKHVLVGAVLFLAAAPVSATTVKFTVVSAAPPQVTFVKVTRENWIPEINKRLAESGQDFKIEWIEAHSGTVAKVNEVLEAVEDGIGHVGLILKNFEESKLPLEQYFYMAPFAMHTSKQMVEIDTSMRKKLPFMNETYLKHKQVMLGSAASESMQMFTTFPLRTVDDLKGHKIGASGAMGFYLRGTGATVVTSSMVESFMNIKSGLYEGYPISIGLAFPYKTHQAAKYYTEVDFGNSATAGLTVNTGAWAQLPEFAKKIFQESASKWAAWQEEIDTARRAQFIEAMKKEGVQMTVMPASERRRWAMQMPNIAKEWAADMDKQGLKGTEVLNTYMNELRAHKVEMARQWDKE
jgi:TRAP-type C4-dicarboxylate transport system substrate-binding protein